MLSLGLEFRVGANQDLKTVAKGLGMVLYT